MASNLIHAVVRGRLEDVKDLCSSGANLDFQARDKSTALICAVVYDHYDIVQELCRLGANLEMMDLIGRTALMWAVGVGDLLVIKTLCDAGANIDCRNRQGKTALTYAVAKSDSLDVVKELCRRGARVFDVSTPSPVCQDVLTKQTFRHHVLVMLCVRILPGDLLRHLRDFV
jgi:ankyrin repeat protein